MQALGNTSSKMRRELEGKSCIYGKIKKMLMNKEFRFRFWSKESNFRKLRLHFKSLDSGKEFCIGGIAESEKPKKKKNQTQKPTNNKKKPKNLDSSWQEKYVTYWLIMYLQWCP